MKHINLVFLCIILTFSGCALNRPLFNSEATNASVLTAMQGGISQIGEGLQDADTITSIKSVLQQETNAQSASLEYPVALYPASRTTLFGSYNAGQYSTIDVITLTTAEQAIPIVAVAQGTVKQINTIDSLGTYLVYEFTYQGIEYHAVYSHLNKATLAVTVDAILQPGQILATLPADNTEHSFGFALYPYTGVELLTEHVPKLLDLDHWLDPFDFLRKNQQL